MKKPHVYALLALCAFIGTYYSCVKDEFDMDTMTITYSPEIAVPLVHSIFSVQSILERSAENGEYNYLQENSEGLMTIIYKDTLFSERTENFITFPPGLSILNDYTGSHLIQLPVDSVDLNLEIYNKAVGGSFYFEDPKIHLNVVTSIGIPVIMTLTTLEVWSPVNGGLQIELDGSIAPMLLQPAVNTPSVPGTSETSIYTYDSTNSNIKAFLANAPKYIYYAVDAVIGSPPVIPNYVTDSGEISVEIQLELPLWGYAGYLELGSTLPFDLEISSPSSDEDFYAESAVFVINTYNGFPIDVNMQLTFIDSNNVVLDSLFYAGEQLVIKSGIVGPPPDFRVAQISHQVTEVVVDSARLDKIASADSVIVRGKLSTFTYPDLVKVYYDQTLEVKLGVRAKIFAKL